MAPRTPDQILAVLEEQAREDEVFDAEMRAIAAMSDAQLDEHLRGLGLNTAQLEKEALALYVEAPSAVQAVPQQASKAFAGATRRRRPLAVAAWLAAGAAAATVGGALLYSLTHRAPEQPAPPAPAPSPSSSPEPAPVAMTPSDQRKAAAAALAEGRPEECLQLLDRAKQTDPAGDATPDVRALRDRATRALKDKPPKP
jgi:hypothetical protein